MTKETPVPGKIKKLDETVASDSLKPASKPDSNPKSKLETIAKIVSAAHSLPTQDLTKWFDDMISQYPGVAKGHGDASSNRNSTNMKAGGTPIAPMGMEKLKAPSTSVNVREDVADLFSGQDLTEEFKESAITLFEAAINARMGIEVIRLEEEYEDKLVSEMNAFIQKTDQTISDYLDYSVDKWLSENEVAIVDSLRLENAEEMIEKFKNVFVEGYFDVPDERVDIVNEMADHVEGLETELSEAIAENARLKAELVEGSKQKTLSKITEGMTLVDTEKLGTLIESIEFTGEDEFSKKVKVIKEKYFPAAPKVKNEGVETLNEVRLEPEEKIVNHDPLVEAALRTMNGLR